MKKMFFMLLCLLIFCAPALADPLDEIREYIIQVDPREDGSLDMKFHIRWEVLNSTSEGPLSWVRIGIPNSNVTEITPISGNIEKIAYSGDGGDYVRIDLERNYYAGEVLDIAFSIHQYAMCYPDEDTYVFNYTPGWFDDIDVKSIEVYWNMNGVASADTNGNMDGYYVWKDSLRAGQRLNLSVVYPADYFSNVQIPAQAPQSSGSRISIALCFLIVGITAIRLYSAALSEGNHPTAYYRYRGFAGSGKVTQMGETYVMSEAGVDAAGVMFGANEQQIGYAYHRPPIMHGRGSHSCACACACACAGGGRAGCSRKDFYNTKLDSGMILEALKDKSA